MVLAIKCHNNAENGIPEFEMSNALKKKKSFAFPIYVAAPFLFYVWHFISNVNCHLGLENMLSTARLPY